MSVQLLKAVIRKASRTNVAVMFWGKPGIGKTEGVNQLLVEDDLAGVETIILAQREAPDIIGLLSKKTVKHPLNPDQTIEITVNAMSDVIYNLWVKHVEHKKKGGSGKTILLVDEANRADKYMTSAFQQLVLEHRVGNHQLPPDCTIVAVCNPPSDDEDITTEFGAAMMNRFSHIGLKHDKKEFLGFAEATNWDPALVGFLSDNSNLIHSQTLNMDDIEKKIFCSPRSWHAVNRLVADLDDDSIDRVTYLMMEGLVGKAPAAAFKGAFENQALRPIAPEVLLNPAKRSEVEAKLKTFVTKGNVAVINQSFEGLLSHIEKANPSGTIDAATMKEFEAISLLIPDDSFTACFASKGNVPFWTKQVLEGKFSNNLLKRLRTKKA